MTMAGTTSASRLSRDWQPSAAEVEAIVSEMRPLVAAPATQARQQLDARVQSASDRTTTRGSSPGVMRRVACGS